MAATQISSADFVELVRKSGLAEDRLDGWLKDNALPPQAQATAAKLVQDGLITPFHAKHMLTGKCKGFILGQYKVLDQIGAGGMGVVFVAEHLTMKRQVAIKVLPSDKAKDEEARERFYREARIVAALDHPNVVHAFDVDKSGDTHFMVMEYIEGESLESMLRRKGSLPARDAAEYIAQAARGLQHAHERGLVHRDIKPANLLLDKDGVVKILDMGLGRFFEESSNLTTELCSGSVIGTADYMAPEQAVNSHDVDIRADIYSLGITLYALLTGQPPYASSTVAQKLLAHHMRQPEPIQTKRPDVPEELSDIVMKMLAKQPWDRYQTPVEVADALSDWIKSHDRSSAPTAKTDRTIITRKAPTKPAPVKKKSWLVPAVCGGVVLVVGIIIGVAATSGGKNPEKTETPAANTPGGPGADDRKIVTPPKIVRKERTIGELRTFDNSKSEQFERLTFAPGDQLVAGAGGNGSIRVWDVASGELRKELRGHNGRVWFVAYSPQGDRLVSAGQDGTVRVWQTIGWNEEKKFVLPKVDPVRSAVFSPDGKTVFAGGDDGLGRFWSVETGELLRTCDKTHEQPPTKADERPEKPINWVAWSPDGALVYTAGWDGTIRGWDAAGAEKFQFKQPSERRFNCVAVSSDSAWLLCGGDQGVIHYINARNGKKEREFKAEKMVGQSSVAFSKEGGFAVSCGNERLIRVWDVETGTPYQSFEGLEENLTGCAINSDGLRIVGSVRDAYKTIRLWGVKPR